MTDLPKKPEPDNSRPDGSVGRRRKSNALIHFSTSLFQMAVIIGGAVWGGHELDQYQQHKKPIWTIVFSLAGIAIALYLVIRDARKLSDNDR